MSWSGVKCAGSRLEQNPSPKESKERLVFTTALKEPSSKGKEIVKRHKAKWLGESIDPVAGKHRVSIQLLGRKGKKVKAEYTFYTEEFMNKLKRRFPRMENPGPRRFPRLPLTIGKDGKTRFPRCKKGD